MNYNPITQLFVYAQWPLYPDSDFSEILKDTSFTFLSQTKNLDISGELHWGFL